MEQQSKTVFASKTFWVNVLTIGISAISITKPEMIGIQAETLLWMSGVINIILRFLSNGSVSLTGSPTLPPTPPAK